MRPGGDRGGYPLYGSYLLAGSISSSLYVAKNDSASALSQHTPVFPIDCCTPCTSQSARNSADVYWHPRSEWKITPAIRPPRVATAIRSASQTSDARRCVVTAQPITRRENTSSTTARYSQPSHVRTYVMSPTHSSSGADAVNAPCTRSGIAGGVGSGVVVRTQRGGRRPRSPAAAINRATRLRPTS